MSAHGHQLLLHPADILWNPQDPVRVVSGEIGFHQRLRNNPGFVAGGAGRGKDLAADLFKWIRMKSRHQSISLAIARTGEASRALSFKGSAISSKTSP